MTGYEASIAIHEGGLCSVIPGVALLVTVVILSAWVANRFLFYFGFRVVGVLVVCTASHITQILTSLVFCILNAFFYCS